MARVPTKAEREIALGIDDPFDYSLAAELGWSVSHVRALPNEEVVRWQAFVNWRQVQRDHARDVAEMRANRR